MYRLPPSFLFRPMYTNPPGMNNWLAHLPFARDLVEAVRPRLLVELGTHYGESYFGLCQAVREAGIPCTCYAVDTWKGDAHAEFYGEAVFEGVVAHNSCNYSDFSYLVRKTFDDALTSFADESIDLLHIDGLHTYEAVSHDFRSWFPKLRPGGVILLHDIAVRDWNFGVWRFWEEISSDLPAFAFQHNWGLGVVVKPGLELPPFLAELLCAAPEGQAIKRRYYSECGERLRDAVEAEWTRIDLVYPGGHGEVRHTLGVRNGCFETFQVRLDTAGPGSIRIHCGRQPGILDVPELSVTTDQGARWTMKGSTGVEVQGSTAHLVNASGLVVILGADTQILLPNIDMSGGAVLVMTLRLQPLPSVLTEPLKTWSGVYRSIACTPEGRKFLEQCCGTGSAEDPFGALLRVRDELRESRHQAQQDLHQASEEVERVRRAYNEVLNSWSWHLTSPLRKVGTWILAARRTLGR